MGEVNNVELTRNQSITNYDRSNVFLRISQVESGDFTNDTYDTIDLAAGTLMGRNSSTGEFQVLASGASDGSQYPVGVLAESLSIEAGDTKDITLVVEGEVAKDKLILDGSDELTTVIDGRQLQDRIAGDTLGIKLIQVDELSGFDNQ